MQKRQIAFYDIDKTSYDGFIVLDLATHQLQNGIISEQCLTDMKTDIAQYRSGEIPYEQMAQNLLEHWAQGLLGKQINDVLVKSREFFETEGKKFFPYVQTSINLLSPTHDIYFVTAGPQFGAQYVADMHNATGFISTIFEERDGVFTGNISKSLASKEKKKREIYPLLNTHNNAKSFAFGDSSNDVEMLESVAYPICVNADSELRKVAETNSWDICSPEQVINTIQARLSE